MNMEELLKKRKKDYDSIKPKKEFIEGSWFLLKEKLGEREKIAYLPGIFFHSKIIFSSLIVIIVLGGFLALEGVAQGALPEEPLYPLKRVSEDLVSKVFQNDDFKMDNRANELIELTKKKTGEETIKKAVNAYRAEIIEKKEDLKKKGENDQKLQEKLKEHEEEFKKNLKDEESKKILDKVINLDKKEVDQKKKENKEGEENKRD